MEAEYLTIKELTEAVGGNITPRMVRHYHTLGLLPPAQRSIGNYRLYTPQNIQQLQRIVALKQQGFQLSHIQHLDGAVDSHPEAFQESLQHLLPDLSSRSEIEVDLLSQLVLACGDVSLVNFVRLSGDAIGSARAALKNGCQIVGDIAAVTATLVGVASPPGESHSISPFKLSD
jgi:precorrin-8X/cobalt-precorrin-8 methylmutase